VTECLLAAIPHAPHIVQQDVAGDEFARSGRKTQQYFHRFWRQVLGSCPSCHPPLQGFDEQIPEIETLQKVGIHGVSPDAESSNAIALLISRHGEAISVIVALHVDQAIAANAIKQLSLIFIRPRRQDSTDFLSV
jgi:hypothetical protein